MNPSLPPETKPAASFRTSVGSALRTSLEIVAAPQRAYAEIAEQRTWIVPYLLIVIVDCLAAILIEPAAAHVAVLEAHRVPGEEPLSGVALAGAYFTGMMLPQVLWWPVTAIAFVLIAPRDDDPRTRRSPFALFSVLFALCVYSSLPLAIGNAVDAVVIRLHDPTTFKTAGDLMTAFPLTLASLAPTPTEADRIFLGSVDVFLIWSLLVTAYGFVKIAKVKPVTALAATFAIATAQLILTALTTQ